MGQQAMRAGFVSDGAVTHHGQDADIGLGFVKQVNIPQGFTGLQDLLSVFALCKVTLEMGNTREYPKKKGNVKS